MIGFSMKDPGLKMRGAAILAAWIGGLVLAGALLWVLTGSSRDKGLLRVVNQSLAAQEETVRLAAPLSPQSAGHGNLGRSFSLVNSAGSLLVFPLVNGGVALPVGALLDEQGKVDRLIPLGNHGRQVFDRVPSGVLKIYIHKIEADKEPLRGGGE
jgi:hypothetical protein